MTFVIMLKKEKSVPQQEVILDEKLETLYLVSKKLARNSAFLSDYISSTESPNSTIFRL